MAGSGRSRAQENREIRRKAMREQLAAKGLVQHVLVLADKLEDLSQELDATEVQRIRAAMDIKHKLISKYLPDIKATEITGEEGEAVKVEGISVKFVDADTDSE